MPKTHRILAHAHSEQQLGSLDAFAMGHRLQMNGIYAASKDFNSYIDAQLYLIGVAKKLVAQGLRDDFATYYRSINNYGIMTIGAVTARIERY